jgi:hypothetical protein
VVQAEAAEEHIREAIGPVSDSAAGVHTFGGSVETVFGSEAAKQGLVVRSFAVGVGRIGFVWEVGRWAGMDGRSFVCSEGIVFVLRARRGVVRGLGEDSCLDCNRPGFEVGGYASVRKYRSAVAETVVEEGIENRFGRLRKLIGRRIENVVVVRSELGIGLSSSWPGILL